MSQEVSDTIIQAMANPPGTGAEHRRAIPSIGFSLFIIRGHGKTVKRSIQRLSLIHIFGSMLICEMAAYYRAKGSSIKEELERIYAQYGRYLNKVDSFEFPGLSGMDKMAGIMEGLRKNPPADLSLIHI